MKRLVPVALLCALAVAGAGCDVSATAATVGGSTITRSALDAQLSQIAGSAYAQCALQIQGVNLPTPLTGAGDFTVNSAFATFELSTLVLERLVDEDLARRHHPVTAAAVRAAHADFVAQLTPSSSASPCPGAIAGQRLVAQLPAGFVDAQVRFLAAQEQLASALGHVDLGQAALLRYYKANAAQFDEVCLSDIAVSTQSQAQSIHDAIAGGTTTFAAQAQQSSIDTQTAPNGGAIPCVPSSQIVNSVILGAIAGLSPGQMSQPVFEAQAGTNGVWFIIQVDGRPRVPFAQAEPQIRQNLLAAQNAAVSAEFTRITHHASVVVDPRYGSWSADQGVRPPVPPRPSDLLSPGAGQASSSMIGGLTGGSPAGG
ncbi:MAG: peptidylprolyl isomerase [Acidimicrobiales bacterium]